MKRLEAILAVSMAAALTGCVLRGKQPVTKAAVTPAPAPAPAPPPPPKPLSTPQTDVQLPKWQPLTPEAIASTFPPEAPPPPPPPKPTVRPRPQREQRPVEAVTPQGPPAPAETTERPKIQEALPANELKVLQDDAENSKREVRRRIDAVQVHRLNRQQNILVNRIHTFVKQSDDAQRRGDMRQAAELANRALVLAKELQP